MGDSGSPTVLQSDQRYAEGLLSTSGAAFGLVSDVLQYWGVSIRSWLDDAGGSAGVR